MYRDVKTEVAVKIDALAYLLSKESDKCLPENEKMHQALLH